jgi:hypothetical protein
MGWLEQGKEVLETKRNMAGGTMPGFLRILRSLKGLMGVICDMDRRVLFVYQTRRVMEEFKQGIFYRSREKGFSSIVVSFRSSCKSSFSSYF